MWRHNECRIANKNPKKELKNSRKIAFSKMLSLIHVNNMPKLDDRLRAIDEEQEVYKQKMMYRKNARKFLNEEFVISHNRIKNKHDLIEPSDDEEESEELELDESGKIVPQISRTSQTDASSFNYQMKRKKMEFTIEKDKLFEAGRSLVQVGTQTEWSPFAEVLIDVVKGKEIKYNLRVRRKN
ncbi:unnamed protein product [Brachionus calyciflorus]|uniref:Uncharacterized protein n=1 Tax=Brachionus calyciflorus TaxID=104777 RepID=A0A814PAK3_9BILA|nr:unnamed protein product [Brachionus calyciflorus]